MAVAEFYWCRCGVGESLVFKLYGLGPVDITPSANYLHPLKKKKNVTLYTWHMTSDMWHLTFGTWHVTHSGGVNIFSQCQLSSSYSLGQPVSWRSWTKGSPPEWINQSVNYKGVYKTVKKAAEQSKNFTFLAAPSSSRGIVVGRSVRQSVGQSVGHFCEKVTFRVLNGTLTLPTYLLIQKQWK